MREEKIAVLVKAFKSSGLKRGVFARAIKVAPGYISDILNGKNINPSDSLIELARIKFLTDQSTPSQNTQPKIIKTPIDDNHPESDNSVSTNSNTEEPMSTSQKDGYIKLLEEKINDLEARNTELEAKAAKKQKSQGRQKGSS